jgi:SAM-dependent methyltransferase
LERLPFKTNGAYSGVEAAIHTARYALARNLCQGKKVLDIACGEGYGSRLLLEWGAAEVVGVDVSEDAIVSANKNFAKPGIRYLCADAQTIDQIMVGEKFDLIVSFETIEHLLRPDEYLLAIARLRTQNSCVVITCPNDWWYYPNENEGNIFHVRKYSYEEFVSLVTAGLGAPDAVGLGTPCLGFANVSLSRVRNHAEQMTQIDMMSCVDHAGLLAVPPEPGSVSVKNSSYFVAAWGGSAEQLTGAAMLPISMDFFSNGFWQGSLAARNGGPEKDDLQLKLRSAESKLESAVKEIAKLTNQPDTSAADKSDIENLSERFEEQCLLTQKYRNQANALLLETDMMRQSLAEKDRIIGEQQVFSSHLDLELSSLRDLLAEKDLTISEQKIYLKALLKRWNLVTAIPRKVLPPKLIVGIKNRIRSLKHEA